MSAERVLLTGGGGFIGAHTAVLLLRRGYAVRAIDWLQPPVHEPDRRPAWLPAEVELLTGDVRDKAAMTRSLRGVDRVVHLAAYQDYMPDFSTFFNTNTAATALLYEVIVEQRLPIRKVVVASSQATLGEGRHSCPEHGVFYPGLRSEEQLRAGRWNHACPVCGCVASWELTDESAVHPENQYALSKHTQELVSLSLGRRYGIPSTCLRYSITQGRWQSPRNAYSGICRIFTLRALSGKAPIVFEDGLQQRDYIHVEDVARANLLALEDPRTDYEAYNVGGACSMSVLQYAETVERVIGRGQTPRLPGLYRFGDTRHIVSDSGKLRRLGWAPTRSIEEIVEEYAGWAASTGYRGDTTDESLRRMLAVAAVRSVTR
ncbi:MAG: NAD-dependent epimerase/dehydratase family protein [Candidatus Dormibacteraeota bacterium]|nr:NAD-dependent epimerase/dehydratase family protein [Candidatus Dormibacteraeota bacterium]